MSSTNDTPVEVAGVPVDMETANAPGTVTVNARPLTRQQSAQKMATRMVAGPTAESQQKGHVGLLVNAVSQAILPIIILSTYYRDDWASKYCETNIAEWALIFGWIGIGSVGYQYLIEVYFWRIKFAEFKAANEDGRMSILKHIKCLKIPLFPLFVASFAFFIIGQIRIWGTHGCDGDEYDAIMAGNNSGCPELDAGVSSWEETDCNDACCFKPMHEFGRIYSIIVFVFMGVCVPCLCCVLCFAGCAMASLAAGGSE